MSYTTIATIAAANNANGAAYIFTDNGSISAKIYYRIRSVDFDGKTNYSNAIIIRKETRLVIDILGNPVQSSINLNINCSDAGAYQLALYSVSGIKLGSMMYSHSCGSSLVSMPVPANAKGQCILQVTCGNEKQSIRIFIQ